VRYVQFGFRSAADPPDKIGGICGVLVAAAEAIEQGKTFELYLTLMAPTDYP